MNRITSLLGIRYPIIQGGMVWCSGWRLASAVSNAGGHIVVGTKAPEVCPVCAHPQSYFEVHEENY